MSWETYERLLSEHVDSPGTRFAYDEGCLEIMVVSAGHEKPSETLAFLIREIAIESGLDCCALGSTTFKREDLQKGFEPDRCFYFAHAALMRTVDEIDPRIHPAPEIVVEVAISQSSLSRCPIFAAFGVQEVWRYTGERVLVYGLGDGRYTATERSRALPVLTAEAITRFLASSRETTASAWTQMVREWARAGR